jgi:hypothetical protein
MFKAKFILKIAKQSRQSISLESTKDTLIYQRVDGVFQLGFWENIGIGI